MAKTAVGIMWFYIFSLLYTKKRYIKHSYFLNIFEQKLRVKNTLFLHVYNFTAFLLIQDYNQHYLYFVLWL